MLKENLKTLRKQKGLSQEELSIKLNVVRQTISKWEQGLSVPDAEMLISISKEFDTSVSELLGENISEKDPNYLKEISEKLEIINFQLAKQREHKRIIWHWIFIGLCLAIIMLFICILAIGNSYMEWNYNDQELSVLGVLIHSFIWVFVRLFPLLFAGAFVGAFLTGKRK